MALLTELSTASLTPEGRALLTELGGLDLAANFYLAGSAALTLYLEHRRVRDLDFMSLRSRLRSPERRDLLAAFLAADSHAKVETARDGYLFLRSGQGVGVRFYHYPYPLLESAGNLAGVRVAAPVDLGSMKLGAIISRALPHDFVDLYLLTRSFDLEELLARSAEKFTHVRDFPLQALRALADIPKEPGETLPELSPPIEWLTVRAWVEREVRPLARAYLGMEHASR